MSGYSLRWCDRPAAAEVTGTSPSILVGLQPRPMTAAAGRMRDVGGIQALLEAGAHGCAVASTGMVAAAVP